MHIVIAAGIFPPDIGGPATYSARVARYLREQGHTVVVVCYADHTYEKHDFFSVYGIGRDQSKFATFMKYFFKLNALAHETDILFGQGPIAGGMQALIVSRMRRIPLVVKITGDYAWEQAAARMSLDRDIDSFQQQTSGLPFKIRIVRFLERFVTRSAKNVIVPSQYLKSMVEGWGVGADRIQVIYNAAPTGSEVQRDPEKKDTALVVSVGRLVPWKGFRSLIESWPQVQKAVPAARLIIVGDGPYRETLESLRDKHHMVDSVALVGKKNPAEVAELYSQADVFVLNSGYEGLSHTILEAMRYGAPVAVSSSGGNSEIINDAENGLLFPYNDVPAMVAAIVKLLTQREAARQYANAASASLDSFSEAIMLSETEQLLVAAANHTTL